MIESQILPTNFDALVKVNKTSQTYFKLFQIESHNKSILKHSPPHFSKGADDGWQPSRTATEGGAFPDPGW
jgi:hypothetical protein